MCQFYDVIFCNKIIGTYKVLGKSNVSSVAEGYMANIWILTLHTQKKNGVACFSFLFL